MVPDGYTGIYSVYDLNNIRNDLAGKYILMTDIIFTDEFSKGGIFFNDGKGWEPIGTDSETPFTGVFDGNGYVIKGLYIDSENKYVGIFGCNSGTIENLGLSVSSIHTSFYLSSESIYAYSYGGGIAGYNDGTIVNCYNNGDVSVYTDSYSSTGSNESYAYAGGIAGINSSFIRNCFNTGRVDTFTPIQSFFAYAGGIAAFNDEELEDYNEGGIIENCYNTGMIFSDCANLSGGVSGENIGMFVNCYYLNNISEGSGEGEDSSIMCTFDEMKNQSTFSGFDFETVWIMAGTPDSLCPKLRSLLIIGDINCDNSLNILDLITVKKIVTEDIYIRRRFERRQYA